MAGRSNGLKSVARDWAPKSRGDPRPARVCRHSHAKLRDVEITLHIPDEIAKRLSAAGGDVSRRAIEAIALEGYRDQTLTLYQVSEMLGFSRVETEDFLGRHHVPLAMIGEAELDREAALFEAASRRNPR
jgi:predicted HTH domain antitoxin